MPPIFCILSAPDDTGGARHGINILEHEVRT